MDKKEVYAGMPLPPRGKFTVGVSRPFGAKHRPETPNTSPTRLSLSLAPRPDPPRPGSRSLALLLALSCSLSLARSQRSPLCLLRIRPLCPWFVVCGYLYLTTGMSCSWTTWAATPA